MCLSCINNLKRVEKLKMNQCKKNSTLCKYPIYRLTTCFWTPSIIWIIWKTCRCRPSPKILHFSRFSFILFLFFCCNLRRDKVSMFLVPSERVKIRNGFLGFKGRSCTTIHHDMHDSSFARSYSSMHLLFQVDCTPAESHYTLYWMRWYANRLVTVVLGNRLFGVSIFSFLATVWVFVPFFSWKLRIRNEMENNSLSKVSQWIE